MDLSPIGTLLSTMTKALLFLVPTVAVFMLVCVGIYMMTGEEARQKGKKIVKGIGFGFAVAMGGTFFIGVLSLAFKSSGF